MGLLIALIYATKMRSKYGEKHEIIYALHKISGTNIILRYITV